MMGIEYQLLDRSYSDRCIALIRKAIVDEPLASHMGLNDQEMEPFVQLMLPCVDSGLTIGAVDTDTGELVGLRMTAIEKKGDTKEHKADNNKPEERKMAMCLKFFEYLHAGVDLFKDMSADELVHFFGLLVHPAYRRRGIARRLVEKAVAMVTDRGYKRICAEVSSNYSRKIYDSLGFKQLVCMRFDSFVFEGEIVFNGIHPHEISTINCLDI